MENVTADFCFSTLALGAPYRARALTLARDLANHAPGKELVALTDCVESFSSQANVAAIAHERTGLFHCLNDKRFAVAAGLRRHEATVFVDADTRFNSTLPSVLPACVPLLTTYTPNLGEQIAHWLPPREGRAVNLLARRFGVAPPAARFVMDNLFAVRRDAGRERVFLNVWNLVTALLDFHGVSIGDGYCISIAAAVTGWLPACDGFEEFDKLRRHEEIGGRQPCLAFWRRALARGSRRIRLHLFRKRWEREMKRLRFLDVRDLLARDEE